MSYRDRPEPRDKTASPRIRWWDHLRYWVRMGLRWLIRWTPEWLGVISWSLVCFTAGLPDMKYDLDGLYRALAWIAALVWTVVAIVLHGPAALRWVRAKDRLEQ